VDLTDHREVSEKPFSIEKELRGLVNNEGRYVEVV
jgi:hypothetical protein